MINKFFDIMGSFKTQIFKCLGLAFSLISFSCFSQEILSFEREEELRKLIFSEDSLFTPKQLQEDFRYYCKVILETHPNPYHAISKDNFDAKVENILKSLDKPMNRREFWLKIATFNVFFDGHTDVQRIRDLYQGNTDNSRPLFSDNLLRIDSLKNVYVNPRYRDSLLAGKYIKSINDIPVKQILDIFSSYYSYEFKNILTSTFPYSFSWLYRNIFNYADSLQIEYINENNEIDVRAIYPRKITPDTTTSSTQTKQEDEWKALRFNLYEEESIAIIEINTSISEMLGKNYRKDLEKMMSSVIEKNIKHLFIDISCNGGGSSNNALEILNFIKTEKKKYYTASSEIRISPVSCEHKFDCKKFSSFVKKHKKQLYETSDGIIMMNKDWYWTKNNSKIQYDQNVYLIQSRPTASASLSLSSPVKAYKFATIIGGETGGLTGCYIDCPAFAMPNTLIPFRCSIQKGINVGGAMDGRGVLPDVEYKIANPYKSFTLEQLKEMLELVEEYKKKVSEP